MLAIASTCVQAEMRKLKGVGHPFVDWQEWKPMGLGVSYFSLTRSEGEIELWFGARFEGRDSLVRLSGKDLDSLKRVKPQFDTRLIKGYDRDLNGIPHPILSRTSGHRLNEGTEVVQASIGPRYEGGGSELCPVLFTREKSGEWSYVGVPNGDPERFVAAVWEKNASVRCEGGGLVQLPDGCLRLYSHGMMDPETVAQKVKGKRASSGQVLIAESESIQGPWTFLRDEQDRVVDITKASGLPWLFPHVQSLGENGVMLTGADQWPPKAVYAAYSRDGVNFVLPVDEQGKPIPLRRMEDVNAAARFCKTLRGVFDPATNRFTAIMNVSTPADRGNSMLYAGGAILNQEKLGQLLHREEDNH